MEKKKGPVLLRMDQSNAGRDTFLVFRLCEEKGPIFPRGQFKTSQEAVGLIATEAFSG